jgi:hypothetical protein
VSTSEPDRVLDIVGCARCHGDGHTELVFRRLAHPVESSEVPLTHWATCPTTGEPILLAIVADA